jgi:hypothetical protein
MNNGVEIVGFAFEFPITEFITDAPSPSASSHESL